VQDARGSPLGVISNTYVLKIKVCTLTFASALKNVSILFEVAIFMSEKQSLERLRNYKEGMKLSMWSFVKP